MTVLDSPSIMASSPHAKDLETQDKYGVKYLKYWFDEGSGKAFCLVEAPSNYELLHLNSI
ncbi:MAG: DUF4242 domain-containing protein [Chloroflexi bacterium]|nr:MAG: DUF4242 domain-containing protein [Chloroflexota bacterium]